MVLEIGLWCGLIKDSDIIFSSLDSYDGVTNDLLGIIFYPNDESLHRWRWPARRDMGVLYI